MNTDTICLTVNGERREYLISMLERFLTEFDKCYAEFSDETNASKSCSEDAEQLSDEMSSHARDKLSRI
jgi:hypothetical protein